MENYLNKSSDVLEQEKPSQGTLKKWRSLTNMDRNPNLRFRFNSNHSNRSEVADLEEKTIMHAGVIRAPSLFRREISVRESEAIPLIGTTFDNSSVRKIQKHALVPDAFYERPHPHVYCTAPVPRPSCSGAYIHEIRSRKISLLRFGPVYNDANDALEIAKEEAWKHILDKSPNGSNDQKTKVAYLDAFKRVAEEARAYYADAVLERFSQSKFQWMMIKDGCFFLQLVLFILGASEELGYPNDHGTFGMKKQGSNPVGGWIKSMFYAGNQIPLIVLNEFMKQDFFREVVKNHGKWERPTDLLSKKVLYDLLVLPAILYANNNNNCLSSVVEEQPYDLLHGLQNLVLGPKISRNNSKEDDDEEEEEEEDEEEDGDLEGGATPNTDQGNAGNDSEELCVTGLRRKGIYFWKLNNGVGIRGIQFKNRPLFPGLYLPSIQLNQETEILFKNLKNYERRQQEGQEIRSFLGLMNKLISTEEDIKHLSSKGILEISQPKYGEKFIRMLQNLSETVTDQDHRHVLQQLRDYSSSFRCVKFKVGAMIVLILTALQTVFGILSYRHDK